MNLKKRCANLFFVFFAVLMATAFCDGNNINPLDIPNTEAIGGKTFVKASRKVLHRLIGEHADEIRIETLADIDGRDVFEYQSKDGVLTLRGSSGVAICRGFYEYIKNQQLGLVSWSGTQLKIPEKWADTEKKRVISPYKHHYYFNVVTYGYTLPYWDWARWQKELDWMALHGIDMPLSLVANEAIAVRVWKKLGLTKEEIDTFYVGPAHLPWQRMGNIVNHDGPLPEDWHKEQVALQHKILARMRELGMKPIVPGFAGFVPKDITRIFPDAKLHEAGWGGWSKEHHAFLLMPDGPLFNKIGKMYIQEWEKEFGKCDYYLADSFNEMEIPAPKDDKDKRYEILADFGAAVYHSIEAGNPDAVWVMQGWMFGYQRKIWDKESLRALLSKVPDDKMLLLDLAADYNATVWRSGMNWDFYDGFFGKTWVYSVIPNMGGDTAFNSPLSFYAKGGCEALNSPNKGCLEGFGMAPEGIENNEVIYELISDMGWRDQPADLNQWLKNYCINRYGAYPAEMEKAWKLLHESCYNSIKGHPPFGWQRRPGRSGRGCFTKSSKFLQAVESFAACSDALGENKLYQADLLELSAFFLGTKIERLISYANEVYMLGDIEAGDKIAGQIDELFIDMDRLLESHPLHRLERWLKWSRSHGRTPELKDYYERNARRIVTVWGPPVDDYAARVWSGLIRDYYRLRWKNYFESLKNGKPFNFREWEEKWVNGSGVSAIEPFGNPVEAALKLIRKVSQIGTESMPQTSGIEIGQWQPAQMSTEWKTLEWALPAAVLKEIRGVQFKYIRGRHRLDIKSVCLVLDGKETARSEHLGYAGTPSMRNFYQLSVPDDAVANNGCILRAVVRSAGGTDSYGKLIMISR